MIGIYKITNILNNKVYIGSSICMYKRWKQHLYMLRTNSHRNKYLNSSYSKYGLENFTFSVLEECDEKDLNTRELFWMRKFNSLNRLYGYNQDVPKGTNLGYKQGLKTIELKVQKSNKIVFQYDFNGTFIKEWKSIKSAAEFIDRQASSITRCCKGKRKRVANFVWRYEGDAFNKYETELMSRKGIKFTEKHKLNLKKGVIRYFELKKKVENGNFSEGKNNIKIKENGKY